MVTRVATRAFQFLGGACQLSGYEDVRRGFLSLPSNRVGAVRPSAAVIVTLIVFIAIRPGSGSRSDAFDASSAADKACKAVISASLEAAAAPPPLNASSQQPPPLEWSSGSIEELANSFYRAWEVAYALDRPPHLRPGLKGGEKVVAGERIARMVAGGVPLAPHLEQCEKRDAEYRQQERRPADGGEPQWARRDRPRPPWVLGTDDENVAGTRLAQVDLWRHQFPPSCDSKRFLVAEWPGRGHGLGSSLHIFAVFLLAALESDRVLVAANSSLRYAQHCRCYAFGEWGNLDCYWFSAASEECRAAAARLSEGMVPDGRVMTVQTLNSSARMVVTDWSAFARSNLVLSGYNELLTVPKHSYEVPEKIWGRPWLQDLPTEEVGGVAAARDPMQLWRKWWNAQAIRFLLRRPTAYLCRLTNVARHRTYGRAVAAEVAAAVLAANWRGPVPSDSLDMGLWEGQEPYIPRPILSMHIRQGDKGREMRLVGVEEFMRGAYRLRLHTPGLRTIWLSTEMGSVIAEVERYPGWTVLYTDVGLRQVSNKVEMFALEECLGHEATMANSWPNLIIASQCDLFVGVLGSNWNRLIDELRKTNGRFRSGIVALNTYGE